MQKHRLNSKFSAILNSELIDEKFQLSESQKAELTSLYEDVSGKFQLGKVISGIVITKDSNGVLVNIDYKSDGLIPNQSS